MTRHRDEAPYDTGMTKHLFSDGTIFPSPGLGTWKIDESKVADIIQEAISAGYRHLDCACDYGNEHLVGEGIEGALAAKQCQREDLWVTSKLWNTYHEPKHVRAACERSLRDLKLEQLDLYLIHFPISLAFVPFEERYPPGWVDPSEENAAMKPIQVSYAETWAAMEELVEAGLTKRIGVCNLTTAGLRDLLSYARIKPAVLQIELHPYLCQNALIRYAREEGIAITAFSPFGADSYLPLGMAQATERLLDHEVVTGIASRHQRTPAQVLLRWAEQRGTVPIPKTQTPSRLVENLALAFDLKEEEMKALSALDQHRRFNDPGVFGELAFNTFYPIFD
jgi:diketogulonate reductase-like aldo/keto reductase